MKNLGPMLLCLTFAGTAACGNGEDSPVSTTSTTPDPNPPAAGTGNVVFSPAGVDFTQWGADDYELKAAAVVGDTLAVTVSFSGGCRTHRFTLVAAEGFMESDPVQLAVAIAHDADGDPCEAYPTEKHNFNLDPIKARYKAAYGTGSGTIVLNLARSPNGPLVYEFD